MPLVCASCTRVNPPEARYCFHDGTPLAGRTAGGGPVAVGMQPFGNPFVFPSGRTCRNFDELVLACDSLWLESRDLLREGYLESYFAGMGRADLALAARQAGRAADPDRGLDELLGKLPSTTRATPRLAVQPSEINLGQLVRGTDRRFVLHLANEGMGLLRGSVACDETAWLTLGDRQGSPRKLFQFQHNLDLTVQVRGRQLKAGRQGHEGQLVIESNGGTATVLVRVEVPIQPFAGGILTGATTPREIAQKAKAAPREAAPLFEKGAIASWYEANGWTYPVSGPAASGPGAVQQFFEALGLVKPPVVEVSTESIPFRGPPGVTLEHVLQVFTREKRYVFAHAVSQVPWLTVGPITLTGQTARIPLIVPVVPAVPGQRLAGKVQVTANGNQRFTIDVALTVGGAASTGPFVDLDEALAGPAGGSWRGRGGPPPLPHPELDIAEVVPVLEAAMIPALPTASRIGPPPLPRPATDGVEVVPVPQPARVAVVVPADEELPPRRRRWVHALPVAAIFLALLVTVIRDLASRSGADTGSEEEPEQLLDPTPRIALHFHDTDVEVAFVVGGMKPANGQQVRDEKTAIWEPSMRFGLVALPAKDGLHGAKPKRLTFEEAGETNNTCVRLDGKEWLFGETPYRFLDGPPSNIKEKPCLGRWQERDVRLGTTATGRQREGRKSVWIFDDQKILVTQTVEIVPGAQSSLLDTCLVRYDLENKDGVAHEVGLRFLLDTFIGDNDGVPFLLPGSDQLCSTQREFPRAAEVPDFLQAYENNDLKNPGTVAHVGLKVPGLDPPDRVTLGAWPNVALGRRDRRCEQQFTRWEVPVFDMNSLSPPDSAVAIYWNERTLRPGERRSVGFSYGLGVVASSEGGGNLALTIGGSFAPEGEFTVTAYVQDPVPGQTVTLTLPDGFKLLSGDPQQTVPQPPAGAARATSPVTWKVQGPRRKGTYSLKVKSSTGASQTQPVKISVPKTIFGN